MLWKIEITEISLGQFKCVMARETGQSVEHCGGDWVVLSAINDAFEIEVASGTFPSVAAFHIACAVLPGWEGDYNAGMCGSWTLKKPNSKERISYDGRDMYLMITTTGPGYAWQGELNDFAKRSSHFFRYLAKFTR